MSTETLTTILISLLIINFAVWLGFLLFLFFQTRKIFKKVDILLGNANRLSTSFIGSVLKLSGMAVAIIKGY